MILVAASLVFFCFIPGKFFGFDSVQQIQKLLFLASNVIRGSIKSCH